MFLLNLLGYEILHLGRVLMEQATRRGWSLRRFREPSGESGATSGEAIDFRHQSRGDRLEAVVEETGAGVLGAGIGDEGGVGPVEGTETVRISHRKVNLSADDGPLAGMRFMAGSIVLFLSRFSRIDRGSRETGLRPHENTGLEAIINMFHE